MHLELREGMIPEQAEVTIEVSMPSVLMSWLDVPHLQQHRESWCLSSPCSQARQS